MVLIDDKYKPKKIIRNGVTLPNVADRLMFLGEPVIVVDTPSDFDMVVMDKEYTFHNANRIYKADGMRHFL